MNKPEVIYIGKTIWSEEKISDDSPSYFSEEHVRVTVFAYLQGFSEFAQSTYGVNISAGTITENIMRNLKGGEE